LWRFIAAGPGSLPVSEPADALEAPTSTSGTAPVLAMLSRLPLDDELDSR
jgi:hypothetical protein